MRYVILGTGVAGMAAIEAIRSIDAGGDIAWVGDDAHGYYSRPGLAYLLTGEVGEPQLHPKVEDELRGRRLHRVQARALRLDLASRSLEIQGGRPLRYDRLLLSTGAGAIPLNVPGGQLQGVVKLDHMEDARNILKLARRSRTAVVIGGGITALEIVEGLVSRGVKVHYLLRGKRYWSNVLDEAESSLVQQRLKAHGVDVVYGAELAEIQGDHRVQAVRLKDGRLLKCDLVGYAIGVQPRLDLAREAGLDTERGILVDETMRTSDANVFAAGDVAQVHDPQLGRAVLESLWNSARQQGRAAGLNMAGEVAPYAKPVSFNVTRLAGLTTTIIGAVGRGRDEDVVGIVHGDSETWRERPRAEEVRAAAGADRLRLLVGAHALLGAVVMGDQAISTPLERLVGRSVDISPIREQLLVEHAPLAGIVADFWSNWRRRSGS